MHFIGQPIRLIQSVKTLCYAGAPKSILTIPAGTFGKIFYLRTRLGCSITKGVFQMPGQFTGTAASGECDWIAEIGPDDFRVDLEPLEVRRASVAALGDILGTARARHLAGILAQRQDVPLEIEVRDDTLTLSKPELPLLGLAVALTPEDLDAVTPALTWLASLTPEIPEGLILVSEGLNAASDLACA
jgi:hypothetical protein